MKKYYNKALFYQSFYNVKWGILGGVILFFLLVYYNTSISLGNVKYSISNLESNYIYLNTEVFVLSLFLLILLVYVMITGFNKRNNITFITGGPYTKEEVKKNEFLFLFLTLCLFVIYGYVFFKFNIHIDSISRFSYGNFLWCVSNWSDIFL